MMVAAELGDSLRLPEALHNDPSWSTVRGLLGKVYGQHRKAKRGVSYADQGSPMVRDSHGVVLPGAPVP